MGFAAAMVLALVCGCLAPPYEGDDDAGADDDTSMADDDSTPPSDDDGTGAPPDPDGDGYDETTDCDETNAAVHPGATETCNDIDDDCDLVVDEGFDADGDGYKSCGASPDCDDARGAVHPGATETCNGVDDDCDEAIDEGFDADGDGYAGCSSDCDDADPAIHPGAAEVCDGGDDDCDGVADEGFDVDVDGTTSCGGDCDDGDPEVHPGAEEACGNGIDDDCDGGAGACGLHGPLALADADARLHGEDAGDWAGYTVAGAGDVNGDGFDDLLIGAVYDDAGGNHAGAAFLVLGPVTGAIDLAMADAKLVGEDPSDLAGESIAGAGDVNGDGFDDLLIGAYLDDSGGDASGAAYLVLGPVNGTVPLAAADARLAGEGASDYAGRSVAGAGDVNGDGYDDLLVGASQDDTGGTDAGAAYLVLGPVSGHANLWTADAKLIGEDADDLAGCSVSGAGDVDGDGYDDVLVGAYQDDTGGTDAGAAYLVLGPVFGQVDLSAAEAKLYGESEASATGYSVSGAGDVNDDGYDDLLIGAYYDDTGGDRAGATYLVLGPVSGSASLATAAKLYGEEPSDFAGRSGSGAGDVNGDGYGDLLIGALYEDTGGDAAGAAYLVLGPATGVGDLAGAEAKLIGESVGDIAGRSVAGAGDVNGDGYDDLLIGAQWSDAGGEDSGAAYLVLGGPGL